MSAAVGVTSLCSTGRVYVGNVDMSNAELIVFNGIYVQLSNSSVQLPIYKHESREQFLHVVFVERRPYWRIGIRRVGGQIDFVDYLGAPSVDDERVTSPDMTSRWHVWSTRSHSWSPVPRLRATCVEPDFVTCTSGLLTVSGLTTRHQRWHGMRTGTYRITSQTNDLRPVYKSVLYIIMAALCNRTGHHIFVLWFLLSIYLLSSIFFLAYSQPSQIGCLP